jgi:hypothetical protein
MQDEHLAMAVSLAKISFNTRERFVDALRTAAIAHIEANRRGAHTFEIEISRNVVELHADEALYALYCDGLSGLEYNVRFTVDEIVREELGAARRILRERRLL